MIIRTATAGDIAQMQTVRNAVTENALSNPGLVTDENYRHFLGDSGKGWVCVVGDAMAGFAIVDLEDHNIWALFLKPEFERRGIGRQLHDTMLNWYFEQTTKELWLGTAPGTRAEKFYRKAGWTETGMHGKGEIKFVIRYEHWMGKQR